MDNEVREALEKVADSYDEFVDTYTGNLSGEPEKQELLLQWLEEHSDAMADDVMEYVDDLLLEL
ncbi:MAG: hypothetical protein LUC94_02920 [Clostridiales bacterium]|nr:hypothetical protein [Clostridiales bacterium]